MPLAQTTLTKQNAPAGGVEQRKAPRKPVLLTSKLVFDNGAHVVDCTIRDISATGARVAVAPGRSIPGELYLLDLANRMAYLATVVSERANGYGLKFSKTLKLSDVTAPELRYLKRIWMESAR
jgi:hypothetical protein